MLTHHRIISLFNRLQLYAVLRAMMNTVIRIIIFNMFVVHKCLTKYFDFSYYKYIYSLLSSVLNTCILNRPTDRHLWLYSASQALYNHKSSVQWAAPFFPQNCPFAWGTSRLIHGSLCPAESHDRNRQTNRQSCQRDDARYHVCDNRPHYNTVYRIIGKTKKCMH